MVSNEKIHCNSYPCSSIGKTVFFFVVFENFSLTLVFCSLNMMCLGVFFLCLICLSFSELPGSVVYCLPLILENSQPLF